MQKLFTTVLAGLIACLPLVVYGQATGTASSNPPAFLQPLRLPTSTGESVEHGEVTLDIGITRRFTDSPAALADTDVSAAAVINERRLQIYTRHVALTEPIKEMRIDDGEITATVAGPGKLLGVIPVMLDYDVVVAFGNGIDSVNTEIGSGWWQRLASKQSPADVSAAIESQVAARQYLSSTQLKAIILEAVLEAVTQK